MVVLLILLLQPALAFLTLDLFFRVIPVNPALLQHRRLRYQRSFALIALVSTLTGGVLQWRLGGTWGLLFATLGWVPWWLLWRFGWRKQFTHLYKNDGGTPVERENPDPTQ